MSVVNKDNLAKLRIDRSEDSNGSSSRWGWRLLMLVLVTSLCGGGVVSWRNGWLTPDQLAIPEAIRSRREVRVVRAQVQVGRSADASVVATGYLESRRQAKIGARAPGRIQSVHVEEGTRVTGQQVLAVLEHADLDASLAAARALQIQAEAQLKEQEVQIARAKRDLDRAVALRDRSGISTAEFDQRQFEYDGAIARRASLLAAIELAKARVGEAEQLRENMFIRASFDGTVISKDAEVGESILPGGMGEASGRGSVVTIADLDHLEVECDVKEDFIGRVMSGLRAEVVVDAVPDERYQGRVRKIIPMGDRARATIKVKVEILDADQRLFPEMSATVYFLPDENTDVAEDQPRVFVDQDCVTEEDGDSIIYVVDDEDLVRRRQVVTKNARRAGLVEVTEGLEGMERCIAAPAPGLAEGERVSVAE